MRSASQPATSLGLQQKSTRYDSVPRAEHQILLCFVKFLKSRDRRELFNYFLPIRKELGGGGVGLSEKGVADKADWKTRGHQWGRIRSDCWVLCPVTQLNPSTTWPSRRASWASRLRWWWTKVRPALPHMGFSKHHPWNTSLGRSSMKRLWNSRVHSSLVSPGRRPK